eukprot:m.346256 g.346256  ORF g.346256 m.346256 type:complete len:239 (+) comp28628_c0_seq1:97-813(+)
MIEETCRQELRGPDDNMLSQVHVRFCSSHLSIPQPKTVGVPHKCSTMQAVECSMDCAECEVCSDRGKQGFSNYLPDNIPSAFMDPICMTSKCDACRRCHDYAPCSACRTTKAAECVHSCGQCGGCSHNDSSTACIMCREEGRCASCSEYMPCVELYRKAACQVSTPDCETIGVKTTPTVTHTTYTTQFEFEIELDFDTDDTSNDNNNTNTEQEEVPRGIKKVSSLMMCPQNCVFTLQV